MSFKKLVVGTVFGVATLGVAHAEWSANVGVASQYIFRGVSFSEGAQVFGGVDWSAQSSGLYAGTWVSTVASISGGTSDDEVDVYAGYGFDLGGGLGLDTGVISYLFPSSDEGAAHGNNTELYVGLGNDAASGTIWYNFGLNGADDDEFVYVELNTELPAWGQFTVGLHAGYMQVVGDLKDTAGDHNQLDYGVSLNAGDFSLAVTNTDAENGAGNDVRPEVTVSWSKSFDGLGRAAN